MPITLGRSVLTLVALEVLSATSPPATLLVPLTQLCILYTLYIINLGIPRIKTLRNLQHVIK